MGFTIDDGSGLGGFSAGVTQENRMLVSAVTEQEIEDHSTRGLAFVWNSSYLTTGIDENVISLKNTNTVRHIHVVKIVVGSDVAQTWILSEVLTGIVAGTIAESKNLNLLSGQTADAISFGNAAVTGVLTTAGITYGLSSVGNQSIINLESALLVQLNNEIVLTASAIGTVFVSIYGYFEENHK